MAFFDTFRRGGSSVFQNITTPRTSQKGTIGARVEAGRQAAQPTPTTSIRQIRQKQITPKLTEQEKLTQRTQGTRISDVSKRIAQKANQINSQIRRGQPILSRKLNRVLPGLGNIIGYPVRSVAGAIDDIGKIPGGTEILAKNRNAIIPALRVGAQSTKDFAYNVASGDKQAISDLITVSLLTHGVSKGTSKLRRMGINKQLIASKIPYSVVKKSTPIRGRLVEVKGVKVSKGKKIIDVKSKLKAQKTIKQKTVSGLPDIQRFKTPSIYSGKPRPQPKGTFRLKQDILKQQGVEFYRDPKTNKIYAIEKQVTYPKGRTIDKRISSNQQALIGKIKRKYKFPYKLERRMNLEKLDVEYVTVKGKKSPDIIDVKFSRGGIGVRPEPRIIPKKLTKNQRKALLKLKPAQERKLLSAGFKPIDFIREFKVKSAKDKPTPTTLKEINDYIDFKQGTISKEVQPRTQTQTRKKVMVKERVDIVIPELVGLKLRTPLTKQKVQSISKSVTTSKPLQRIIEKTIIDNKISDINKAKLIANTIIKTNKNIKSKLGLTIIPIGISNTIANSINEGNTQKQTLRIIKPSISKIPSDKKKPKPKPKVVPKSKGTPKPKSKPKPKVPSKSKPRVTPKPKPKPKTPSTTIIRVPKTKPPIIPKDKKKKKKQIRKKKTTKKQIKKWFIKNPVPTLENLI